jgi:hypothetical protein
MAIPLIVTSKLLKTEAVLPLPGEDCWQYLNAVLNEVRDPIPPESTHDQTLVTKNGPRFRFPDAAGLLGGGDSGRLNFPSVHQPEAVPALTFVAVPPHPCLKFGGVPVDSMSFHVPSDREPTG